MYHCDNCDWKREAKGKAWCAKHGIYVKPDYKCVLHTKLPPFIVAFSGSHNTGKTTLATKVAARLSKLGYKVKFVPEAARRAVKNKEMLGTVEAQVAIFRQLLTDWFEANEENWDFIIFDRAIILPFSL